jgi:hypothetical protein
VEPPPAPRTAADEVLALHAGEQPLRLPARDPVAAGDLGGGELGAEPAAEVVVHDAEVGVLLGAGVGVETDVAQVGGRPGEEEPAVGDAAHDVEIGQEQHGLAHRGARHAQLVGDPLLGDVGALRKAVPPHQVDDPHGQRRRQRGARPAAPRRRVHRLCHHLYSSRLLRRPRAADGVGRTRAAQQP